MSLKIRQLKAYPEYYDQMISLVEGSFGYESGHSVAQDFAPLFSKKTRAHNFLFFNEKDQLVGHIGVLEKKLIYKEREFPVILIGGVCVPPDFRGQGHLKEMMSQTLSLFEDQYLFALLWSSMTQMYEKFGFFEAGQVVQTGNEPLIETPQGFNKVDISQCSEETWEWIQESYRTRARNEGHLERSQFDWEVIREMRSVSLYVNENTQEYFMVNKGMDLPGIIHEYTPRKNLNSKLARFAVWTHPQKMNQQDFHQMLYLSFMKIGSRKMLSDFLSGYSNRETQLLSFQEEMVELKIGETHEKRSSSELLRSLFGPGEALLKEEGLICFTIGGVDSV